MDIPYYQAFMEKVEFFFVFFLIVSYPPPFFTIHSVELYLWEGNQNLLFLLMISLFKFYQLYRR